MTAEETAVLWRWIADVEAGAIIVTPDTGQGPLDVYAGNVHYTASDGSQCVVFNDCNSWDYFDSITLPSGKAYDYDALDAPGSYRPDDEIARLRYGIPL
jgi:hypothetical protein